MMGEKRRKRIFWIFLVFSVSWMGMIFYFSAQPAVRSSELSTGVMDWVLVYFSEVSVLKFLVEKGILEFIIRKIAHIAEYGVFAVFLGVTIRHSKNWCRKWQIKTVFSCFLYAATDEFHQLFVQGRSGQVRDVLIDTAGACGGVLVLWLCYILYIKYRGRQCF